VKSFQNVIKAEGKRFFLLEVKRVCKQAVASKQAGDLLISSRALIKAKTPSP